MEARVLNNESSGPKSDCKLDIATALFPRIRGKVLALFMLNPEKKYYFRETARIIGDAPASIQRELMKLTAAGILTVEPIGIQKFYTANRDSPVFEELRSMIKKTYGVTGMLKEVLGVHRDKIRFAWINDSPYSDGRKEIDITIIGSLWIGDLASILEPVEASLGRPLNPTLYTAEDYRRQPESTGDFSHSEKDSEKLYIVGSQEEFADLFAQ